MASFFLKHLYIRPGQSEQSIMLKHRWTLRFAWLWLCVFFAIVPAMRGAADTSDSPFIVKTWNNEQGLPQSSVISVIQTRDGYLWLGTLNGLVRFDGTKFTIFNDHNTPGLNSDRIVYLFEDSRTNLWIGTDTAGVALLQGGKLINFEIGRAGHEGRLLYAYEDTGGLVWFYTADGHSCYFQDRKMATDPSMVSLELMRRASGTWLPSHS